MLWYIKTNENIFVSLLTLSLQRKIELLMKTFLSLPLPLRKAEVEIDIKMKERFS